MHQRATLATVVLVRDGSDLACWPLVGPHRFDIGLAEQLARGQLVALRMGYSLQLRGASVALLQLLGLVGLAEVFGMKSEVIGQAEEAEQRGVDEVVVTDDPVA